MVQTPSWLEKYVDFSLTMSMDGCKCRIQYIVASDHGINAVYRIIAQRHMWNFFFEEIREENFFSHLLKWGLASGLHV
jgi:hypothetical protein